MISKLKELVLLLDMGLLQVITFTVQKIMMTHVPILFANFSDHDIPFSLEF